MVSPCNQIKNNNMESSTTTSQTLTFGQKAVGLTFNHGEGEIHQQVHQAKQTCADAIDQMKAIIDSEGRSERAALATIAYRKLQQAQMDMVKAITWKD
jgi:hypothetical protein